MAKKEKNIGDVVDELKKNRKTEERSDRNMSRFTKTMLGTLGWLTLEQKRDRLRKLEEEKERKRAKLDKQTPETAGDMAKDLGASSWGIALGVFKGGILAKTVENLATFVFKPLLWIGKFLLKSGPIAIAVTALYFLLRDIGENPEFAKLIEEVKTVWNDKVLPLWRNLSESIGTLFASEEFQASLALVKAGWDWATSWFKETFVPAFQFLFIDTIRTFATALGGVTDAIQTMLDGDLLGGLWKVVTSMTTFMTDMFDVGLSFLLSSLGLDLGPDGRVFTAIGGAFTNLANLVKTKFDEMVTFFTDTIPAKVLEMRDAIVNGFFNIVEKIRTSIAEKLAELDIMGRITAAKDYIMDKVQVVIDGFKSVIDMVVGIPDRIMSYVASILPDWMKGIIPESYETPDPVANSNPNQALNMVGNRASMGDINDYLRNSNSTGTALQAGTDALRERRNAPVVIAPTDARSNTSVSNNSTVINNFPSAIPEAVPMP